ncbi:MAG: hypothetical protein LBU34_16880 [Planctomycetaceae bacterium]|jgi:hypothetical protein|nr:hypothetical protein [Planctomycetaceae bacterium]
MPLDPYSICPGGREKKLRFCCSDIAKELEQIEQMLSTQQNNACLAFIETLEKSYPDRACLIAAKLSLFRSANQWDKIFPLAQSFYQKEPNNPIAALEYAYILAFSKQNPKQAISLLIDVFEHLDNPAIFNLATNMALRIGNALFAHGFNATAVALAFQLKQFPSAQEHANNLLYNTLANTKVPILLRNMTFDFNCPDHFPKKEEFTEAMTLINVLHWKQGLAKLESLTQYDNLWHALWRNIAIVRFWLLEINAACDALKKYVAFPDVPLEDAADAESVRIFLTENGLGDQTQIVSLEYEINDADTVCEKLLSNPFFCPFELPPPTKDQNVPPAKKAFLIIDRPFPAPEIPITIDNVSSQLATLFVFGKETDRAAQFAVIDLAAGDRLKVEHALKDALGDFITNPVRTQFNTISKSETIVHPRFLLNRENFSAADFKKLETDYYEQVFINRWCKLPFGILDGKTPNEVAHDPAYRIRLLGMIQVIGILHDGQNAGWLADRLRKQLDQPAYETIVVPPASDEEMKKNLEKCPVWRWHRFETEKLPTAFLADALQIAATLEEHQAAKKFASELLNRPAETMTQQIRELAYESLILIAQGVEEFDTALEWIEKAKKEAALKHSQDAPYYLHEIPIRLALGQVDKFGEAVNYLIANYGKNEKVMKVLQSIFIQCGIVNPDGTPNTALARNMQANMPPESNKIWTPETTGVAQDSTRTKLWVPEG